MSPPRRLGALLIGALLLPAGTAPAAPKVGPWQARACPSIQRCCAPGAEPCVHPGLARLLLAGASGVSLGLGAAGFQSGGDSLGAGDPYAQALGGGLIGLAGITLGSLIPLISPRGEAPVEDRVGTPTVRLKLSPGGTSTVGEEVPWGLSLSLDPTLAGGPIELAPHFALSTSLGTQVDVDPRPQLANGGFPTALRQRNLRVEAGLMLAVRLPYPLPDLEKPAWTGPLELRFQPRIEVRRRTLRPGEPGEQTVEQLSVLPFVPGLRWHLSPRQRFTVYAGPRLDRVAFTDPGGAELHAGEPFHGGLWAEIWYQIDVPFTPAEGGSTHVAGRLNLGYVHSKADGQSFDWGASVGFFGPLGASFDLRIRRRGAPVALQVTAGMWLGRGGGPFLELGLVAPDVELPTPRAPAGGAS